MQMPVGNLTSQSLLKGLSRVVSENLAIGECVIRGAAHGGQVSLAFGRVKWSTDQLAVGEVNAITAHSALESLT